jgi:F-type H+-transporting ATPase subunit a
MSDILHIKDSYYFDVPRKIWRVKYDSSADMASHVGDWFVRNDPDFQEWEADQMLPELQKLAGNKFDGEKLRSDWHHWQHANDRQHGRPLDQYIEDSVTALRDTASKWVGTLPKGTDKPTDAPTAYLSAYPDTQLGWMLSLYTDEAKNQQWEELRASLDASEKVTEYTGGDRGIWPDPKLKSYNHYLSGKVFIPQPFATLRNAYEKQSGFAISKYMIIEVIVAVLMVVLFRWLAKRMSSSVAPKGKLWNAMEAMLSFIKTDIVEKGIHHHSEKYVPLFWTIFMFILGCNLMGMIPWIGSPTASIAVTGVLALVIFFIGTVAGIKKFGAVGFLKNFCPEMGLPWYMAIAIVPMVWVIEFASLFIKHTILAIRLLANMAAGHLVLLGILGLAFGVQAARMESSVGWSVLAIVSILGTTILSVMELGVAFLQAYVFSLLAALFIGSATEHH